MDNNNRKKLQNSCNFQSPQFIPQGGRGFRGSEIDVLPAPNPKGDVNYYHQS
jgi:hypothetical protein